MHTYLISKDTTKFPQNVAHLYEHWFINSFYGYAAQALKIPDGELVGYIGGDTYENILFIEAWFYSDEAAQLFETFLTDEELDQTILTTCIQQCQAEDRVLWTIEDTNLQAMLKEISQQHWKDSRKIEPFEYDDSTYKGESPISSRKSAASYKTITIVCNLDDKNLETRAVFLRFYVILSDIIGSFVRQKGWYVLNTLGPRENKHGMYFVQGISLSRSVVKNAQLASELREYLFNFDIAACMPLVKAHMNEFAHEQLWNGRIREDLRHNKVISGNLVIARLAIPERLQSILDNLEVTIENESYTFAKNIPY